MNLAQILMTCIVCGLSPASGFGVMWWPIFDAGRVFISCLCRIDFLLREQLPGQEAPISRDRRTILLVNAIGLAYAPTVFLYKPFMSAQHLEFAILVIAILFFHIISSLPLAYHLLKDGPEEDSSRPLLDAHRADSYDSASNSPALDAESAD